MTTTEIIYKYSAYLADGQKYLFYPGPFEDIRSLTKTYKKFKVKTVVDCINEDWKTAVAQKQPRIPAGTELYVKNVFTNYYGRFIEAEYSGYFYYLDPRNLSYVGCDDITY